MTLTTAGQQDKELGRKCRKCATDHYGIDSGQGCTACTCSNQGSSSTQCDSTGQCPCKDSVKGVKCNQCKDGFFGFGAQGCSMCNCTTAGSTSINCEQSTGVCTCKENVQGNKCGECKSQMFNLAATNPKGCQPCFCFKHGQQCVSMKGYEADSIRLEGSSSPLTFDSVYGQRHSSYGTELSLGLTAAFTLNINTEKLLTFEGNGQKMYHMARPATSIPKDATLVYKVRFLENDWKKDVDGTPTDIPALEIMDILGSLSKVSYLMRSQGQDVKLTYFEMETVKENSESSNPLSSIEQCTCNPTANVAGLSCENCASGFLRQNGAASTSYDGCVACNCNSRGATTPSECNPVTGICLNCRNGTVGDRCESCASNVTGTDCDTCLDDFWGLQQDGCRPCACSSPGSTATICDKVTGQCPCAANIGGRTCDKCEENFHRLTASGCIECERCYSLLKESVGNLRTIRDTLVKNVSKILERNDNNTVIKPFTVRFQETVADTNNLIVFLNSAEESENEVQAQIVSFSGSLVMLETQLTTIDNDTLPLIETNLAASERGINMAQQYRTKLETDAKEASSKLDTLESHSLTLTNLANDLKEVKDTLQALADASSADREILKEISALNVTVLKANQLAMDILVKAQAALEIHKNTTGKLLSLESSIIALVNKAKQTSTSASNLATQSQETKDSIAKLQKNLADLTAFVIDFDALKLRTTTALALTESQKTHLATDQAAFEEPKTKAAATVPVVRDLTTQSNNIGNTATEWISRSNKAEEQAQMIVQKTKVIFDETEATLTLLKSFDTKAKEVETQANAKLEQVSSVQTLSQKLIEDSQTLTDSLSSLQQTAVNAKETSEQAKQVMQTKLTQMEGVERKAKEVKSQLETVDPGASKRLESINTAKTNIIQPNDQLCSDLGSKLTSFNTELASTDTVTTSALGKVGSITERANAILTQLRGLETVDADAAQTLLDQTVAAHTDLKVEDLTALINGLLTSKNSQRDEIDRLKGVKDTLGQKVNSLKTLLQQIRPATTG